MASIPANSISLGNSAGILTEGVGGRYGYLAPYTASGATLNVTVTGDLTMPASTIAALAGGNVTVTSTGGSLDLGSQDLVDDEQEVAAAHNLALGIYTSGVGNVTVTAPGTINIDSSRIAAFNGGAVNVESFQGAVDAGSGGASEIPVYYYYVNPQTGAAAFYLEDVYASGIAAETLVGAAQIPRAASLPGNILVQTPQGDIDADQGGILQEALNGNNSAGPTVTLIAGSPGYIGNINLGQSGVIGGSINATANGNINGLIISRQDSNVNAAQNFSGTVLSGGNTTLSAGGSVAGTIIGVSSAEVSGGSISANVLSSKANVNGQGTQTALNTGATATTAATAAAGETSNQNQTQVTTTAQTEDDPNKKKPKPALVRRVKRVTVLLPNQT